MIEELIWITCRRCKKSFPGFLSDPYLNTKMLDRLCPQCIEAMKNDEYFFKCMHCSRIITKEEHEKMVLKKEKCPICEDWTGYLIIYDWQLSKEKKENLDEKKKP